MPQYTVFPKGHLLMGSMKHVHFLLKAGLLSCVLNFCLVAAAAGSGAGADAGCGGGLLGGGVPRKPSDAASTISTAAMADPSQTTRRTDARHLGC